jgi:hypothetical protein
MSKDVEDIEKLGITLLDTPNEEMEHENLFRAELDSRADRCCVGYDVLVVNTKEQTTLATPFLGPLDWYPKFQW